MKFKFLTLFIALLFSYHTYAQTADAKSLTLEGNDLAKQKNYAGAVEKYKAALAADADYAPGNYQIAFALVMMNKGLDGIPYLQKVFKAKDVSVKLLGGAYNLAGSIYDQNSQPKKAIAVYKQGIDSLYAKKVAVADIQPLEYNLALAYFRDKQYQQAERSSGQAMFDDTNHAGSQRVFALVAFHQNARARALLTFCSFLLLEPNTPRSAEALGNIQNIMNGGVLKREPGQKVTFDDKETIQFNKAITSSIKPFATRRYASSADLLADQLKAIFVSLQMLANQQQNCFGDAINDYFVGYFYKLSQTPHMPAFARLISQTKPESATWIKAHTKEMADLDNWIKTTRRW